MKRSTWGLLAIAVVIGLIEPHAELAFKCREGFEHSEACVWGRAYLPLGQVVVPLVVTPIAGVGLLGVRWLVHLAKRSFGG